MKPRTLKLLLTALLLAAGSQASALEPNRSGPIIAQGATRAQIEATPILQRPYRPLHVYGNTVRRRHYRGTAVPAPRDAMRGTGAVLRSR